MKTKLRYSKLEVIKENLIDKIYRSFACLELRHRKNKISVVGSEYVINFKDNKNNFYVIEEFYFHKCLIVNYSNNTQKMYEYDEISIKYLKEIKKFLEYKINQLHK